ncbi:hypothetical protein QYE76_052721 [Lolium multiflorum]|uniref:Transposase (putative) gypsy type domain-containing protein n=1 Tax=Lolium multiflorum TaxID=4521 RepID=A0AAD8SVL5_LOLMU|nr:hypothetical protein QYE76_052721 [Lolium multiflorum]
MAAADLGAAEWERSKITNQDLNLLKKLGISKKPKAVCFPSEESYPTPPMGYRVSFVDHLIRGLSAPIHPFLRGLLYVYGLQLHHLTPNSILHISIFITLCEAFLGVQPNWALWKRIFFCRRNGSANVAYNIGGVVISVRSSVNYFDVKLPDSVQGWRKKWLYIRLKRVLGLQVQRREINHIATGTAPSLDGELLPPHGSSSGDEDGGGDGSGVDGEAFRGTSPLGGCRNRDSCPPDLGFAMAAALELFSYRGFLRKGFDAGALNRRRGGAGGSTRRRDHRVARPGPGPRHHVIWAHQGPSRLSGVGCFRAK